MMLTVSDRILRVPSPWQICLSPLFIWLTLHKDDGVCRLILTKEVGQELSRIHNLLAQDLAAK